ncbi:MAG: ribosome silencing factor [Lutibacter sp.]|uniref:ribosome silencing factor n=1 Tax=Lutibacter sp. TaxID=1925666 RepID=UPI0017CDA1CB|nr:ribosome silencing factor [Lutibacter sp.]MBT8317263.1 ribosome silencing factor [Lutibacter sp.]NNJ58122.1 ribosome silencing factor [Lutibacter sp.]
MTKNNVSADDSIAAILKAIDEVKGLDIQLLDLREIENTVCDYFVICTGTSNTHINAISGIVQKQVSKATKEKPWHIEGEGNAEWILLDYVNIVVHVFQKQVREYYDIESLWGDAKITTISSSAN